MAYLTEEQLYIDYLNRQSASYGKWIAEEEALLEKNISEIDWSGRSVDQYGNVTYRDFFTGEVLQTGEGRTYEQIVEEAFETNRGLLPWQEEQVRKELTAEQLAVIAASEAEYAARYKAAKEAEAKRIADLEDPNRGGLGGTTDEQMKLILDAILAGNTSTLPGAIGIRTPGETETFQIRLSPIEMLIMKTGSKLLGLIKDLPIDQQMIIIRDKYAKLREASKYRKETQTDGENIQSKRTRNNPRRKSYQSRERTRRWSS